jgi:hypothetical protein
VDKLIADINKESFLKKDNLEIRFPAYQKYLFICISLPGPLAGMFRSKDREVL